MLKRIEEGDLDKGIRLLEVYNISLFLYSFLKDSMLTNCAFIYC